MVGMVVRDKYALDFRQRKPIFAETLLQGARSHSNVYEQSLGFSHQQIAVTAASTAKRYKL
jgi:hypothetical protein